MKMMKAILLIAVAVAALTHNSDGQPARPVAEQMRLAQVMPRGAMVYVQARDLSQLMKSWLASPVRAQFYKSASFTEFSRSRIYLKLQDRMNDFGNAIGVSLDENRMAELAGAASAISIYDIGKLEIVFVTEVARERAVATALFKQAPQFQERSADASVYYVREVTTDGGRLSQQFCFAHNGGKLIITTTEGLMIRALKNAKGASADSLLSDLMATVEQAKGFAPHDLTMWIDQARLNRNRFFNNYWIHHNVSEKHEASLANIESGIIDLRITPQGLNEQRWFKMAGKAQATAGQALNAEQASALSRFAPADAHLVEMRAQPASPATLSDSISQALFGKLPGEAPAPPDIPDRTRSDEDDSSGRSRTERYSRLDTRFDRDVDDEHAPPGPNSNAQPAPSQAVQPSAAQFEFAKSISAALAAVSPAAYSEMVRSRADAGKPFVSFERAVVIEMKSPAAIDRGAIERAITDELRARYVVSGVEPRLNWQEEAGVRFVAQSLLEQGAAYVISGKYLVMASSRQFAGDILQASTAAPAPSGIDAPVEFFALVRVAQAKPVFDKLMSKLDGRTEEDARAASQEDQEGRDVKFFSENLSSLIASTAIREMRLRREVNGDTMVERINYSW